jgi:hypothetical protein
MITIPFQNTKQKRVIKKLLNSQKVTPTTKINKHKKNPWLTTEITS